MQQSSAATQSLYLGCGRLLHTLTPPRSAFLYLQFLAWSHPYILLHFYTCTHRSALIHAVMPGHVDWCKERNVMQANAAPANVTSNPRVLYADQLVGLVISKIIVQAIPPIVQRIYMFRMAHCVTTIRPTAIWESARHTMISVRNISNRVSYT